MPEAGVRETMGTAGDGLTACGSAGGRPRGGQRSRPGGTWVEGDGTSAGGATRSGVGAARLGSTAGRERLARSRTRSAEI